MNWSVEFLNVEVRRELEAQPKDILASFLRISRLIEAHGLQKVHEPYVKHLEGRPWEMRMKGRDGLLVRSTSPRPRGAWLWCGCSRRRRKRRREVRSSWLRGGQRRPYEPENDSR
jgi:hypothetical protein